MRAGAFGEASGGGAIVPDVKSINTVANGGQQVGRVAVPTDGLRVAARAHQDVHSDVQAAEVTCRGRGWPAGRVGGQPRVRVRARDHGSGAGRAKGGVGPSWEKPALAALHSAVLEAGGHFTALAKGQGLASGPPRAVPSPANVVSFQQLQPRPKTMKGRPNGEALPKRIRCIQIVYVEE